MDNTIFGVIFGQNVGIRPPGVYMYRVTPHCYAINFEEIPSCFVLNAVLWLLCIIKWSNSEVIWIIPIFGVFFGQNVGI